MHVASIRLSYHQLLHTGSSKVAGCWRKSPPTWLVLAGYSAWDFFTDGIFLNKISLDWPLTLTTQPSTSKISDNLVTLPICIEPAVTCHAEQIESTEYSFLLITYWPITNEHKKEFVCFYDQTISSKVIKWVLLVNTIWYNNAANIFQASYAHLICDFILEFKIIIIITFIYYLWR